MNPIVMAAFADELAQIEKDAGLKDILMTPIPGTRDWVIPTAEKVVSKAKPALSKAVGTATKRTSGGAYDVSHMARAMGVS